MILLCPGRRCSRCSATPRSAFATRPTRSSARSSCGWCVCALPQPVSFWSLCAARHPYVFPPLTVARQTRLKRPVRQGHQVALQALLRQRPHAAAMRSRGSGASREDVRRLRQIQEGFVWQDVLERRADDCFRDAPIAPALGYGLQIDTESRAINTDDEPIPSRVAGANFLG